MMKTMDAIKGVGVAVNTNDYGGDLRRFDDYLSFIEGTGADYAEFGAHGLDVIVGGRLRGVVLDRIAAICARHPLRYTLHAPSGLNLMDDRYPDVQWAVADALLEMGRRIGAELLVLHAGRTSRGAGGVPEQRALDSERDRLAALGELAQTGGVQVAMENLNASAVGAGTFSSGMDLGLLSSQIARVGHANVGLALDFSHALNAAEFLEEDYFEFVSRTEDRVTHLHLNDSAGRPKYDLFPDRYQDRLTFGIDDLHLPLGWGGIDYERILPNLRLAEPALIILEIDPRFGDQISDSVRRARELGALVGTDGIRR